MDESTDLSKIHLQPTSTMSGPLEAPGSTSPAHAGVVTKSMIETMTDGSRNGTSLAAGFGLAAGVPSQDNQSRTEACIGSVRCIIYVDEIALTRECITKCLQIWCEGIEVYAFPSVRDCFAAGVIDPSRCLILYNMHGRSVSEYGVEHDLPSLQRLYPGAPVVLLSDIDQLGQVQKAFARGARGYIPTTSTTLEIAVEVIRLVRAGGSFVPASSLGDGGNSLNPKAEAPHRFTPRQTAVLQYLRQGKANKIIAYELDMSESTVKVHVRNIMRKMKAVNRTEVAFRLLVMNDEGSAYCGDR